MRFLPVLATLALSTSIAAADHDTSFVRYDQTYGQGGSLHDAPQNRQPQTEPRYQAHRKLADVRLFGHRARIELPTSHRDLDYLELRAGRSAFVLRDVIVQFADGSSLRTGSRGIVEPFEGRVIDLPRNSAPVVALIPIFDTTNRRGTARMEVFGIPEHRRDWRHRY